MLLESFVTRTHTVDHNHPSEPPEMYSLHQGTVQGIQTFGCFVELPGFRSNGLVHITQIRNDKRVELVRRTLFVRNYCFFVRELLCFVRELLFVREDYCFLSGSTCCFCQGGLLLSGTTIFCQGLLVVFDRGNCSCQRLLLFCRGLPFAKGLLCRTVYYLRTQSSNRYPFVSLQVTDEVNVGKTIWVKVIKCEPNMNGKGGWKLSLSMQVCRGLLLLSGTSVCQGLVFVRDYCLSGTAALSGTTFCQGLVFVRDYSLSGMTVWQGIAFV